MGALSSADVHPGAREGAEDMVSWPSCFQEDLGISTAAAALHRVNTGWGGSHARSYQGSRAPVLLPFLDREASIAAQEAGRRTTG